jgi:hypothetical protein
VPGFWLNLKLAAYFVEGSRKKIGRDSQVEYLSFNQSIVLPSLKSEKWIISGRASF